MKKSFIHNYKFSLVLIGSIILGSVLGLVFKERAMALKPLGDIFLNLLFTLAIPIVFFSIAQAVAGMTDLRRLGKILSWMLAVFVITGIMSSAIMLVAVKAFPPARGIDIALGSKGAVESADIPARLVDMFTVPEFSMLLSRKNMLALIVFALIIGIATARSGEKGKRFAELLASGNHVMGKAIELVMLYAPVGLGAYFAYLVGNFGSAIISSYKNVMLLYYPVALLYFFIGFSLFVHFAGGAKLVKKFWANILPPSLTAWATGSSVATIPVNLEAAENIGVSEDVREVVIPIGATIHMDGSCLAAIVKISVLFGIFGWDFSGPGVYASAIGAALLSGIVMSGIPGGGFLGELMIVTLYGFPVEALPIISMIGVLVDPPATMVNSVGDNVACLLVERFMGTKQARNGRQ